MTKEFLTTEEVPIGKVQRDPKPFDARTCKAVLKVAKKRLPILGDKALNSNLDHFCGSYADAFRAGAEEAQGEIIARICALIVGGKK